MRVVVTKGGPLHAMQERLYIKEKIKKCTT